MLHDAWLRDDDLLPDRALRDTDPDRFEHELIAGQLARLVRLVGTPTNIALFGAWGSGKTSFYELLRRRLAPVDGVKLVYYDAWKFGGKSLLRNLISHSASELDLTARKHARFHRGLYESHRTVDFDFSKIWSWRRFSAAGITLAASLAAAALLVVSVALAVTLGSAAIAFTDALQAQMVALAPRLAIPIAAVVLAVFAVDLLKIESEKSAPTEAEEFHRTFTDLVHTALDGYPLGRLVVFIDELDRCTSDDVAATLTHLKTFLGNDRCVFIVAADRAVVEEGLESSALSRPVTHDEPYYSSASGYLDKIFQHQFALPPLRSTKLNTFAYELVEDRGGLWAELKAESGSLFDDVMYALIPTYVRSPRRVKVLLNNFATTARVAQARRIDWKSRATEIAKLTVLQTEYPGLARDLHVENRLPTWLLDPPQEPTPRQQELMAKHALEPLPSGAGDPEPVAPDRLLKSANPVMERRQREELKRYLQRTSEIPDPGRDLLFLDALGAAVGLNDPALSRVLEEVAPEEPLAAVAAISEKSTATQVIALRVLAETSERERGRDQRNIVRSIVGTAEGLQVSELQPVAAPVLAAIRNYEIRTELEAEELPGALRVAVAAGSPSAAAADRLLAATLGTESLDLLLRVVDLLEVLEGRAFEQMADAVGTHWAAGEVAPILRAIDTAESRLEPLLHHVLPTVRAAIEDDPASFEDEAHTRVLEALLAGNTTAGAALDVAIFFLSLTEPTAYEAVNDLADELLRAAASAGVRNELGLRALLAGPPEHWVGWKEALTTSPEGNLSVLVGEVLVDVFVRAADVSAQTLSRLSELAETVLRVDQLPWAEGSWDEFKTAAAGTLRSSDWWASDDLTTRQGHLFRALLAVSAAVESGRQVIDELLVEDTARALVGLADTSSTRLSATRQLAMTLSPEAALALDSRLPELGTEEGQAQVTATKLRLRAIGHPNSKGPPPWGEVATAVAKLPAERDEILATWLALDPNPTDVAAVVRRAGSRPPRETEALAAWAERLTEKQRTRAITGLLSSPNVMAGWLTPIARSGVQEHAVVRKGRELLRAEPRADRRLKVVNKLLELKPASQGARRELAETALDLLKTEKIIDVGIAADLVPLLESGYGRKKALAEAFRESNRSSLTRRQEAALRNAGLVPKHALRRAFDRIVGEVDPDPDD